MIYHPVENIADKAVERELQRIAAALARGAATRLPIAFKPPIRPVDGSIAICDGSDWNPIGDGIKRPVWYNSSTDTWNIFA